MGTRPALWAASTHSFCPVLVAQGGDTLHRQPEAEHVGGLGAHHQPGAGAHGLAEGVQGGVVVPGDGFGQGIGHPPGGKGGEGPHHRVVLQIGDHHVVPLLQAALQHQVQCLGAAGLEDDALRAPARRKIPPPGCGSGTRPGRCAGSWGSRPGPGWPPAPPKPGPPPAAPGAAWGRWWRCCPDRSWSPLLFHPAQNADPVLF